MEELILKAKNGDEQALEAFFLQHKELVSKVCRRYFLIGGEKDDIIQEGMIGLYKALIAYDNTKNASFKTFATLCITRQLMNAIKKYGNLKNSPLNNGLSINMEGGVKVFHPTSDENLGEEDSFFYVIPSSEPNPQEQLLSQERLHEMHEQMESALSTFEKQVLSHYLKGKSQMQISIAMNITPKSVDNAISRIKTKLSHFKSFPN